LAATITSFLLAVEIGGQKVPWASLPVFGLFGAGFVGATLFYFIEKYWALEPIFPLELLWKRDVITAYIVCLLQIAAQLSVSVQNG
jgi:hypothetical protein